MPKDLKNGQYLTSPWILKYNGRGTLCYHCYLYPIVECFLIISHVHCTYSYITEIVCHRCIADLANITSEAHNELHEVKTQMMKCDGFRHVHKLPWRSLLRNTLWNPWHRISMVTALKRCSAKIYSTSDGHRLPMFRPEWPCWHQSYLGLGAWRQQDVR